MITYVSSIQISHCANAVLNTTHAAATTLHISYQVLLYLLNFLKMTFLYFFVHSYWCVQQRISPHTVLGLIVCVLISAGFDT